MVVDEGDGAGGPPAGQAGLLPLRIHQPPVLAVLHRLRQYPLQGKTGLGGETYFNLLGCPACVIFPDLYPMGLVVLAMYRTELCPYMTRYTGRALVTKSKREAPPASSSQSHSICRGPFWSYSRPSPHLADSEIRLSSRGICIMGPGYSNHTMLAACKRP